MIDELLDAVDLSTYGLERTKLNHSIGLDEKPSELEPQNPYVLQPEAGLRAAHDDDHHALEGRQWQALQDAIDQPAPFVPTLQACAACAATLRIPLRDLLHYHGGVRVFRTRQLLLDVQALSRHRGGRTPHHPSGS
ncbi:MAG: hypothetical protein MUE35_04220 [Hydrogenophaga sp.]|nr:hypothetical protein [Hydrogenophaga sp.]